MENRNKIKEKRYHRKRNLTKGNTNVYTEAILPRIIYKNRHIGDIENRFKNLTQWES